MSDLIVPPSKKIYKTAHLPFHKPDTVEGYDDLNRYLAGLFDQGKKSEWGESLRWYCQNDLFYLLNYVLADGSVIHSQTGQLFHKHPYYLEMCRAAEYHAEIGYGLEASARSSGKSVVRSKALPIQMILNYPDIAIIIFSITLKMAKKHLGLIKTELQHNELLKTLFDDVLWQDPKNETLKLGISWSLDEGIKVKGGGVPRRNNTIEVHALLEGGPTGSRPDMVIADDVENSSMVNSDENIDKLKSSFSEGISLITPVVLPKEVIIISNTRFSKAGLIESKMKQFYELDPKSIREVPAEDLSTPGNGPLGGTPLYPFTAETLQQKYDNMEIKQEYGLQYALDFNIASSTKLNLDAIKWYADQPAKLAKECVIYICIDASRGIYDPTCMWVWGLGPNKERYWLDAVVRKMDPTKPEFHDELERLVRKWKQEGQRFAEVRVDQMGNQAWAEIIKREFVSRGMWDIIVIPCTAPGKKLGSLSAGKFMLGNGKADRIYQRWSPLLSSGQFYAPKPKSEGGFGIESTSDAGSKIDVVDHFINNEFKFFPRSKHDDMLDASSLLMDEKANEERPLQFGVSHKRMEEMDRMRASDYGYRGRAKSKTWMSA